MSKQFISILFAIGSLSSLFSQTKITEKDACLAALTRILDEYPDSSVQIVDVSTARNKDGAVLMYEVETTVGTNVILSANITMHAYNYCVESGTDCEHCLVGCTGVAMGQVMYYWKYPVISRYQVNWGWYNRYDSYFELDDLTPGDCRFNYWQHAVFKINQEDCRICVI